MTQFLLACLSVASLNQLDITASGLDYWVAWRTSGYELEVRASSGAEVTFPDFYDATSLTVKESASGVPENLIVMISDFNYEDSSMIYSLDPATLATLGSVHVPYAQICPPAREHDCCNVFQLEAQSVIDGDTDCVVFASVKTNYTLFDDENRTYDYTWQCAMIMDIDDPALMSFRESAVIQMIGSIGFIAPVQTGSSYWISGWGTYMPFPYIAVYIVELVGYNGLTGSGELDSSILQEIDGASYTDATAHCAGNCAAGAVFLWENYEGVDQYSFISSTSSTVPDATLPMPPWPDAQPPLFMAMSDVRDDPGALLAWYDGEHVWCRYFDGQWNDWCYRLSPEEPIAVGSDFLSVCSAQDGYYVAWLEEGSADPTVVYVPRSGVEGIEGSSPEAGELFLRSSSNPFTSSVTVLCSGSSIPDRLDVYDITGKLVRSLSDRQGDSFLWDGCDGSGSEVPIGTYLIRGAAEGRMSSLQIVKI